MQSLRWRHPWLVCCAALLCAAAFADARAQDQRRFEIRNAFVELQDEAWLLDVRLDLKLGKAAQQTSHGCLHRNDCTPVPQARFSRQA